MSVVFCMSWSPPVDVNHWDAGSPVIRCNN